MLDIVALRTKVSDLLYRLDDNEFLYVSTGSEGDGLVSAVMRACVEAHRFDQQFIIHALFESGGWREQSDHFAEGVDTPQGSEMI